MPDEPDPESGLTAAMADEFRRETGRDIEDPGMCGGAFWFKKGFAAAVRRKAGWANKVGEGWAFIWPNGNILLDSAFKDEAHAFTVALGWPDAEEIAAAKKAGARAAMLTVIE